jgi:hypothetical protein
MTTLALLYLASAAYVLDEAARAEALEWHE